MRAPEDRPLTVNTLPGSVGELLNLVAPRLSDWLFHRFDRMFPDSAAARSPSGRVGVVLSDSATPDTDRRENLSDG